MTAIVPQVSLKRSEESDNPLARHEDVRLDPKRQSAETLYDATMRSGGEPFGAPFESGTSTLTERIVKLLRQAGFFGFETMEKLRARNRRNKFTRHGAAPFVGDYPAPGGRRPR